MKLCMLSWGSITDVLGSMGSYLLTVKKIDVKHVVYDDVEKTKLESLGLNPKDIYVLLDYMHKHWNDITCGCLEEYEKIYQIQSLTKVIYCDRHLRKLSFDKAKKFVFLQIKFWEELFTTERPDYLISEPISTSAGYLAYLVGKKLNCVYLGLVHGRVPNAFYVTEDEYGYNKKLNYLYRYRLHANDRCGRDFIIRFKQDKTKPSYMLSASKPPKPNINNLCRSIKNRKYRQVDYFFNSEKLFRKSEANIKKILRYLSIRFGNNNLFDMPKSTEEFILFPLHYQPEASTMVQSPYFENQVAVIENIAKSLPSRYLLYVKEHYAFVGSRDFKVYRLIKRMPNVRLINPYVDTHTLIKKSALVITITSTVGWESIIFNRPLIVLGNVFYDQFAYANKTTDLTLLTERIIHAISTFGESRIKEESECFVNAYLKSVYDGNFDVTMLEHANSTQNVIMLCEGLLKYICERNNFEGDLRC